MAGNQEGARKTAETNKRLYGEDYYARIGAKGGRIGRNGGFGSDIVGKDGLTGQERARVAGLKGGQVSKRGPNKSKDVMGAQAPESEI